MPWRFLFLFLLLLTPALLGVIGAQDIQRIGPMHPQQILGQVPGVAIAVINIEGYSAAICRSVDPKRHNINIKPSVVHVGAQRRCAAHH